MTYSSTSPSTGPGSPEVFGFYDDDTGSIQYLVADPETAKAALVDVVLGFDPESAATHSAGADAILSFASSEGFEIEWILDMPDAFDPARDFDRLFADGDEFQIGNLPVRVMLTPGHTLGSITYVVGDDAAFVHDTFMQPDVGTSRADFPGGSAGELYDSLQAILSLPDRTRLFIGHDYGSDFRETPDWVSTVAEQRRHNAHIGGGVAKAEYVKTREERDKTLALPDRMLHVLQMNLRAGRLPEPESDDNRYLKIPLNRF